jgi:cytochrome P450
MTTNRDRDGLPDYDPQRGRASVSALADWAAHPPRWTWWLLRALWPIPRLSGWAAVTRYDDVAEVLTRSDVFKVPFDLEIARLNDGVAPGTPFILGIDDKKAHDDQQKLVMQAFRRADVETKVKEVSRKYAERKVGAAQNRRIDAIPELITGAPLEVCRAYYGIELDSPQTFAYATIDVSGHLFGPPPIAPRADIDQAAAYVRAVVDRAIEREIDRPSSDKTVLARLIHTHPADPEKLSRQQVRAFLIGMIVGFVPTNTMAGGHILEMLLRKRTFMDAARAAAEAGDDDLLKRCLFEAMRFMPLNPGPFRICESDVTVAADTPRATTVKAGTKVLASTMSAMFDRRRLDRPRKFDPRRPAADYMLFGFGMHWCVGFYIAQAQIAETMKALLAQPGLRRARGAQGKLKRRGLFPDQLFVQWGPSP